MKGASGSVLIIDNEEDIRTILSTKISRMYPSLKTISVSFSATVRELLEIHKPNLVVCDVPQSEEYGFWLHNLLSSDYPNALLILFVSENCILRNIPKLDRTFVAGVVKYDFNLLYKSIQEALGVSDTNLASLS